MLERYHTSGAISISAVVDMESQRSVVYDYLSVRAVQPETVLLVDDELIRRGEAVADLLDKTLLTGSRNPWGCIVATEPMHHRSYAEWALTRGMHVLLEKPITACDLRAGRPEDALRLVDDYDRLSALARAQERTVVVQTQRRAHPGYVTIKSLLEDTVGEFGVPVTYLDAYHADGTWNMPWEFVLRDGHPYRYGYGKLLHSGYHFVDLLCWLGEANHRADRPPTHLSMDATGVGPADLRAQITDAAYERLFGADRWREFRHLRRPGQLPQQHWGETDVILVARFLHGQAVVTSSVLSLLQSTFSRRGGPELPLDTYKSNGRVRHERLTVQIGPLLSVQAHSYQDGESFEGGGGFEVVVYRNRALIGGEAVSSQTFSKGDISADSLGNQAREELFRDFLEADGRRSGIQMHKTSVRALATAVHSLMRSALGAPSRSTMALDGSSESWFESSPDDPTQPD